MVMPKGVTRLIEYSEIIDRPDCYTREEKIKWQDERHLQLFPEKYKDGVRITE